ncbi:MAG TPA: DNA repair protein RecO [Myxococcota bacterium]|jgi:DNA repair protein RecO (recombination protein O)
MRAEALADAAVVTGTVAYGESDLVAHLFTREHGRVAVFARSARASRKRFPGLSAPQRGLARFHARTGRDLLDLDELDVDPSIMNLAQDLRALGHASYLCELVERLLPEHEPSFDVFDAVDAALVRIARVGPSATLLRSLELKLLLHTGYLPQLDAPMQGLLEADFAALPEVDDDVLRAVARLFSAHLRHLGGAPLKSVAFLASLVAGPGGSR